MPFFRGREYQSFFQDLDSTQGFYAHRWGDAPIRLLGLAMYAQPAQVQLLNLPYSHKVASQQYHLRLGIISKCACRFTSTWHPYHPHPFQNFEQFRLQFVSKTTNSAMNKVSRRISKQDAWLKHMPNTWQKQCLQIICLSLHHLAVDLPLISHASHCQICLSQLPQH